MSLVLLLFLLSLRSVTRYVRGNGYMVDPPARASMWRLGYSTPVNFDDMSVNCGGFSRQWIDNKGLCGVCGDPYNGARQNEAGGLYATGIITRTYKQGGVIPIRVNLTSSHGGWFEFRLCPNNDVKKAVTQECLGMHLLSMAEEANKTRYIGVPSGGHANPASILMKYQLPANITCNHCVLQWMYNTGKDWGCDNQGVCALGLGQQEQFIGCADIAITADGKEITTASTPNKGETTPSGNGKGETTQPANSVQTTPFVNNNSETTPKGNNNDQTTKTTTYNNDETTTTTKKNNGETMTTRNDNGETTTTRNNNGETTTARNNNGETTITRNNNGETTTRNNNGETTTAGNNNGEMTTRNNNGETTTAGNNNGEMTTRNNNGETTTAGNNNGEMTTTIRNNNGETTTSGNNNGETTTLRLSDTTTMRIVTVGECQAKGVLAGMTVYDQLCQNMCESVTSCAVTFCNAKCQELARQRDICRAGGPCPLNK